MKRFYRLSALSLLVSLAACTTSQKSQEISNEMDALNKQLAAAKLQLTNSERENQELKTYQESLENQLHLLRDEQVQRAMEKGEDPLARINQDPNQLATSEDSREKYVNFESDLLRIKQDLKQAERSFQAELAKARMNDPKTFLINDQLSIEIPEKALFEKNSTNLTQGGKDILGAIGRTSKSYSAYAMTISYVDAERGVDENPTEADFSKAQGIARTLLSGGADPEQISVGVINEAGATHFTEYNMLKGQSRLVVIMRPKTSVLFQSLEYQPKY